MLSVPFSTCSVPKGIGEEGGGGYAPAYVVVPVKCK